MINVATLNGAEVQSLHDEAEDQAYALLRQRVVTKLATAILMDLKADGPAPPAKHRTASEVRAADSLPPVG